jgi:NTP pyrophosphatase (non-canonical NTP hydrolase)
MTNRRERSSDDSQMADSQLSELQNMRVLLEEARGLTRNLAYHRRARLEAELGDVLDEVDRQIIELRAAKG